MATAFAPASVGNVGVGFDLLGHALESPGDLVTATRSDGRGVRIAAIHGVTQRLPLEAEGNTAGRAAMSLLESRDADFGVELTIRKGIALGSGMGGSAASAVAAAVAVNALLPTPLAHAALLECAIEGECVASGARHADNIAPCLLGGLVLTAPDSEPVQLPVPEGLCAVLVRPHLRLDTRAGRALLRENYALGEWVTQAGHLAGFISACYRGDIDALGRHLVDTLIEPQRAHQIPGFAAARDAALAAGAIGCSISGSGPALFAWVRRAEREEVAAAMQERFAAEGLDCEVLKSIVDAPGAHLVRDIQASI